MIVEIGFDDLPLDFLVSIKKISPYITHRRIIFKGSEKEVMEKVENLKNFKYKKSMRWGGDYSFIRPPRWVFAVDGKKIVEVEFMGIKSQNFTFSHRMLMKKLYPTEENFFEILKENFVIPSVEEREKIILREIENFGVKPPRKIVDFFIFSTEYPYPILCEFSHDGVPERIVDDIIYSKIFGIKVANDKFLVFADNPAPSMDVKKGYELALRVRLDDARFYIKEDRKIKMSERVHLLQNIVFYGNLTYFDRAVITVKIADFIYAKTGLSDQKKIKRGGMMMKADLTTGLIREFPEHQGYIGMYYALLDGEDEEVARAIYEHYLPQREDDPLPQTPTGTVFAIADKLFIIFIGFGLGFEISGEGDPYGLRRYARGLLRILCEKGIDVSLQECAEFVLPFLNLPKDKVFRAVDFIKERAEAYFKLRKDIVRAVFRVSSSPYDALLRAKALSEENISDMLIIYKRVSNIISEAQEKGIFEITDNLYITKDEERILYEKLGQVDFDELFSKKDYKGIIRIFSELRKPIEDFFNGVLVLDEDNKKRKTRLTLLNYIKEILDSFANLKEIERR